MPVCRRGRIDAVLGEETDRARTAEQDLRATLETAREHLAELAEQLERLTELLGRIQQTADGERLSPLPAPMASFDAHVEEQTRGSEAQAAVRRERDFVEFAWLRGDFPAEATAFFDTVTAQDVRRSAEAFARGNRPAAGSPDMAAQGAAVAALVERWGGAGEVARRAITLFGLVGNAADAGLAEEVLSRLGVDPQSASLLDGEDAAAAHPDEEIDGLGGEPPGRHPAERGTRLSSDTYAMPAPTVTATTRRPRAVTPRLEWRADGLPVRAARKHRSALPRRAPHAPGQSTGPARSAMPAPRPRPAGTSSLPRRARRQPTGPGSADVPRCAVLAFPCLEPAL